MSIWQHRPLFLGCSVFIAAAALGFFLNGYGKLAVILALVVLALAVGAISLLGRLSRRAAATVLILAAVGVAALGEFLLYFDGHYASVRVLDGQVCHVEGVITERRGSGGNMTTYAMAVDTVDGKAAHFDAILTCYYVSDLRPGDVILLEAEGESLATAAGDYYEEYALMADGFSLGLASDSEEDYTLLASDSERLSVRIGQVRRALSETMALWFGDGAAGLPQALLLGERGDLSDAVQRDFSRSGVAHLLAISGLHMTLLFGMLEGLLRMVRMPRRVRAAVLGLAAFAYLAFLGFPPSATRAVIMLGVTYLSYLCASTADPLTSLGLAGALILLLSPWAVADVGFWLSFSSTLGLVTVMPLLNGGTASQQGNTPIKRLLRAMRRILVAVACGLVAMTFSFLFVAAVIGELGVLSPLSTLLLTPTVGFVILGTLVSLVLYGTWPGIVAARAVALVCGWMCDVTELFSDPEWVVISLRHPAVLPIAAVMTVLLAVALGLRLPRRWMVGIPAVGGWVTVALLLSLSAVNGQDTLTVDYLQPSSTSEMLVLTRGGEGVICDLSNGSQRSLTAAARQASDAGAVELSAVVLTHYHSRTPGALSRLLGREKVRALWLPRPADEEDYYLMLSCLEKADAADTEAVIYTPGDGLTVFGDATLCIERTVLARSVQPVHLVTLSTATERLTLCGGSVLESDLADAARTAVAESDTVIFGKHGPVIKQEYACDFGEQLERICFADRTVAAYFEPECLPPEVPSLMIGQMRVRMRLGE